jgi:hypothetical protein
MSTATDATLIALGERFEKLLLEHMDAWLTWAPRMRAARAEVEDNTASVLSSSPTTSARQSGLRGSSFGRPQGDCVLGVAHYQLSGYVSDP